VDAICDEFEAAWLAGHEPRIEEFLPRGDSVHEDALFRELLLSEWDLRWRHAPPVELQPYLERFAQSSQLVAELWDTWHAKQSECSGERITAAPAPPEGKPAADEGLSLHRVESPAFAHGRYQVRSLLGEGGQKRVFLARDSQLDRDVVIGVLNRRQIESDSLNRLRREAKAMARLDEHPNVASVYDIGEEDGNPFIVTQYVRGGSVSDVLSACSPAPLQLTEAIRIAAQTCRALNHAHAHGILHRDVKPRNVWLTRDGTVKLGDFGLALSLDRTELNDEDLRAGTAAYIAPEQALGSAVSPQSDLYSLGVMLYEMVAGRRPFSGDTALAVISQHVNSRPVAPSWHNPAINDALDRLILELLAKSPADRPTSAAVVADSLDAMLVGASPAEAQPAPSRETTSLDRLASGVFVGRIQEMTQLREGLKRALTGHGRLFLISGEPGSGKTRLTEELTTYARMRGCCVLVGKCFDGEGAPAFWPWVQAIRRYTHDREPSELHDVMGAGAADIAQLDSEIRQRLPVLPTPPTLEPEQARFRLFDSITTFLRNAGNARPLLLILDDL
jgi:tRNA A-37 threonylcarbamoyl transferase component Bud32